MPDALELIQRRNFKSRSLQRVQTGLQSARTQGLGLHAALRHAEATLGKGPLETHIRRFLYLVQASYASGGKMQSVLEGLKASVQASLELTRRFRVQTIQVKLQARIVAFAPVALFFIVVGMSSRSRHFFLATTPGYVCLLVMVSFNAVALVLLSRMGQAKC